MGLNSWFDKGITSDKYINSLEKHSEAFSNINSNFTIPNDEAFFQTVKEKKLRVVILAEPWCGHCMLNIPILFHLAEKTEMPVRILPRDENLELMDQYLTNGKSRTIPIFIFIDQNGDEVCKWGPVAERTKQFVDKYRKSLPAKDAEGYKEKFTEMIGITSKAFREDSELWNGAYDSMKQTLVNTLNNQ